MAFDEKQLRETVESNGQGHLLRFWGDLDNAGRERLATQIGEIDFRLMNRLIEQWVKNEPEEESFDSIDPVPTIGVADPARPEAREAWDAGEEALRAGRVGLLLVAGGQGTRLGFDGPKGSYPIGPVTGRTLFEYHAAKIRNLQKSYGCTLPWYIMVSEANGPATRAFFQKHDWLGLRERDITFFTQRMVPCVDDLGRFMLEAPDRIATNPNGHGGSIPACVERGITADCRERGVDTLSYFQVDNWAVKVADPYFIGYHVLAGGEMSSKNHRKNEVREAVGVHCMCDGEYRVIEYTALDLYPQLLDTAADGSPKYFAGNPAIHILDTGFIERVYANYDAFPWWRAHKKIPHLNDAGEMVKHDKPNGFKFETFVFDALRFIRHKPVALLINRAGEYTPIKQFDGPNSVVEARKAMADYWGGWLDAAGCPVPRGADGRVSVPVEISPEFALLKDEFVEKAKGRPWILGSDAVVIDDEGRVSA